MSILCRRLCRRSPRLCTGLRRGCGEDGLSRLCIGAVGLGDEWEFSCIQGVLCRKGVWNMGEKGGNSMASRGSIF